MQFISIDGDNEEWKKAQKKLKKKSISEIINNNIPIFKFIITFLLWKPYI